MEDLEVPSFWETSMWWRHFFLVYHHFFPDNMAIKVTNFGSMPHFQTAIWHDQQLDFVFQDFAKLNNLFLTQPSVGSPL